MPFSVAGLEPQSKDLAGKAFDEKCAHRSERRRNLPASCKSGLREVTTQSKNFRRFQNRVIISARSFDCGSGSPAASSTSFASPPLRMTGRENVSVYDGHHPSFH
jgi:hypothetical protein